jgi:hypothetical protein
VSEAERLRTSNAPRTIATIVENLARVDDFALLRSPGCEATARRSRMKISGGIFARSSLDRSADADLAFEFHPIKAKRGVGIRIELSPFIAVVIREETEAARIDAFEQNDADRRLSFRRGGGEAHRVDVANVGGKRGGEPGAELFDRVRMKISAAEPVGVVFMAQCAESC